MILCCIAESQQHFFGVVQHSLTICHGTNQHWGYQPVANSRVAEVLEGHAIIGAVCLINVLNCDLPAGPAAAAVHVGSSHLALFCMRFGLVKVHRSWFEPVCEVASAACGMIADHAGTIVRSWRRP
jgi:hypothetical protein